MSSVVAENRFTRLARQALSVYRAEGTLALLTKMYYYLGMQIFGEGFYQKPIINCIRSHATNHRAFIDIGANVGLITTAVAPLFERCLSIEPSPRNVSRLKLNIKLKNLKNVEVIDLALGDQPGDATFFLSKASGAEDAFTPPVNGSSGSIKVRVTTLDQIIREFGVIGPYLIKIDVQGWELHVFRGAQETLEKQCTIISEFWPYGLKSSGCEPEDYIKFINEHGYIVCDLNGRPIMKSKLDRLCKIGKNDPFVTVDILFKKDFMRKV